MIKDPIIQMTTSRDNNNTDWVCRVTVAENVKLHRLEAKAATPGGATMALTKLVERIESNG